MCFSEPIVTVFRVASSSSCVRTKDLLHYQVALQCWADGRARRHFAQFTLKMLLRYSYSRVAHKGRGVCGADREYECDFGYVGEGGYCVKLSLIHI